MATTTDTTTVKLRRGGTCTVDADTVMTHAEWMAEGRRRFGDDMKLWRLRCSTCGHEASVGDHAALAPAGKQAEWGSRAPLSCLGRSMLEAGKGVHASDLPKPKGRSRKAGPIVGATHNGLPIVGEFGSHAPCDWTTGGLFGGGSRIVLFDIDGEQLGVWAFEFAEVRSDG